MRACVHACVLARVYVDVRGYIYLYVRSCARELPALEHLRKQWNIKHSYKLDMKELSFGPSKLDYFPVPWCNLPAQYMLEVDCSRNAIKEIPEEISRCASALFVPSNHTNLGH